MPDLLPIRAQTMPDRTRVDEDHEPQPEERQQEPEPIADLARQRDAQLPKKDEYGMDVDDEVELMRYTGGKEGSSVRDAVRGQEDQWKQRYRPRDRERTPC